MSSTPLRSPLHASLSLPRAHTPHSPPTTALHTLCTHPTRRSLCSPLSTSSSYRRGEQLSLFIKWRVIDSRRFPLPPHTVSIFGLCLPPPLSPTCRHMCASEGEGVNSPLPPPSPEPNAPFAHRVLAMHCIFGDDGGVVSATPSSLVTSPSFQSSLGVSSRRQRLNLAEFYKSPIPLPVPLLTLRAQ